ncbi:beta-propeller domain-containing protein [uncultured Robinsoniella sp.]|uniref:beta-propeller domain-containing protein n=1 Tax=uncultured Robinsoniella sp. TaxID=904190 RepID=UPI00374E46D3
MDEKDLLNRIKKSADSVQPPESLKPDQIKDRLEHAAPPVTGKKKKFPVYRIGAAAAVILIAFVCVWTVNRIPSQTKNEMAAAPESAKAKSNEELFSPENDSQASDNPDAGMEESLTEAAVEPDEAKAPAGGASNETSISASKSSPDGKVTPAKDYDDLYKTLAEHFPEQARGVTSEAKASASAGTGGDMESAKDMAMADGLAGNTEESMAMDTGSSDSDDYSSTNIQETGVDEGDVVKTDGKYLYILGNDNKIHIIKADGSKLDESASIDFKDFSETIEEFYISKDTLNVITTTSSTTMQSGSTASDGSIIEDDIGWTDSADAKKDIYSVSRNLITKLYTYDISDRSTPKLTGTTTQDGYYQTSRKTGDYIYLFSEYTPVIKETREHSTIIPKINGKDLPSSDIYIPEYLNSSAYLVVTAIDTKSPDKILTKKAIVSATYLYYVSTENIYICTNDWNGTTNTTQIMKFKYDKGSITPVSAAEAKGSLNNSFSLNEYNGYLRIVTTSYSENTGNVNNLYIFDESLNPCGKLENLAPGETIQSARFMGDTGYFVTFRQMDPLFSVDLTDPENPKLLGELKITGFSSYLHFYGKDKLLGIGYEVDPDSGAYKGMKLSMFDLSDPSNVKEVHKYIIKDANESQGLINYKAIMINPEKNLFGFHCRTDNDNYMVFSYDPGKGFQNQLVYSFKGTEDYSLTINNVRGLYINDTFYLSYGKDTQNHILSFDINNSFKQLDSFQTK